MAFTLKEELALIRAYIWHTKRDENTLRRRLSSTESKCEQLRSQLRHVLKFMRQKKITMNMHLKQLSKTENTLREQIDNIFDTESATAVSKHSTGSIVDHHTDHREYVLSLNQILIEIVQHRNDHESRLDSSQSTFKLISTLLNDETKPYIGNACELLFQLDDNISKSISQYIQIRRKISQIQNELVQCVEKRELANHVQYKTSKMLKKQCQHTQDDDNNESCSDDEDDDAYIINKEILKNEVIKLAQDIHQRSGLIRQHRRNGVCHLRVFVGSELVTWMVKSDIVSTRYEALILSSLLIDYGYVYCAHHQPSHPHRHRHHSKRCTKTIKVLSNTNTIHPSITVKPVQPAVKAPQTPKAPNKLLLGASSSSSGSSNASCISSSDSTPSSVVSIASSLSTISAISGTPSCGSLSHASNVSNVSSTPPLSNTDCSCGCAREKCNDLSFHDNNDLYRFKVDDSRIERISKMGFLEKFCTFRCKKRHYIWDGVTRQLREYKNKGDSASLYRYSFHKHTQIKPNHSDECVLMITLSANNILKLKAASARERDSWIRVMSDISLSHFEPLTATTMSSSPSSYNNSYEEYRHLRMINRLKWSSLIKSVGSTQCNTIALFRDFIMTQNKLSSFRKTDVEGEVHQLFGTKSSPIFHLFDSFSELFLEPFGVINIDKLERSSIDSIITLCVDDLSSFLEIAHHRLINLLVPVSLRKEAKPRPIIKLLYKLIKSNIYSKCFSYSIYKTIFALYQRIHLHIDDTLHTICKEVYPLSTRHYHISEQLQIDKVSRSPFEPCFDKLKQLSHCYSPTKKLHCLIQLQQQIIQCIDSHRQNHCFVNDGDSDNDNDLKEEIQIIQRERGVTYHIMSDEDGDDGSDMNVSLISYESAQSEKQKPFTDGDNNKKCKQLLIASDDMIPLFCFVLVQSQIKSVHAEIAFMNDFMSEDEGQMRAGFYLTTLQAATSSLLDRKIPIQRMTCTCIN
eukprot:614323_1